MIVRTGIKPTRLYSTNRDVDALNERELSQLPGEGRAYEARDQGQGSALRHLQQNCLAPALLQLKLGAQVVRASACFMLRPFAQLYSEGVFPCANIWPDSFSRVTNAASLLR